MTTVSLNAPLNEGQRREQLYKGQLFVFATTASTLALCAIARDLIAGAFEDAGDDPRLAQFALGDRDFDARSLQLQATFAQHPPAKVAIREVLRDFGCDLEQTYFHGPVLRAVTHGGFLTPWGEGATYFPHRDTWFSAPSCQINWWLPVYDIATTNALAFHTRYWDQPVRNGSAGYDYDEWTDPARGKLVRAQVRAGQRQQPRPEERVEREPELRLVCPAGGIIMFPGAHLHSTVPNTSRLTRFSFEIRTANLADVQGGVGAPNLDAACTGTWLRDFVRAADFAPFPLEAAQGATLPIVGARAGARAGDSSRNNAVQGSAAVEAHGP